MSRLGLNLPNLISLGRLLLVPLAISLILEDSYWAAFWVFVVAGVSDALDGFIAKRFDLRTRLGALLDPLADKVLLVSVYVTLGIAGQIWTWLVVLVVFRDVMIVGGFLLIQALAGLPKPTHPLFISKVNTGVQVAMVGYVLARRGLDQRRVWLDLSRVLGPHSRSLGAGFVMFPDRMLVFESSPVGLRC